MANQDPIKSAVEPITEQIHRLIEGEIRKRLEPLEQRIAELERLVQLESPNATEAIPMTPPPNPGE